MSADLGGPILEVAISLAFVFFLLSLIVSAVTEGFAWATKQRASMLEKGVIGLLGEEGTAEELLSHPLAQTDITTPAKENRPSYLSARNFGLALVEVLKKKGGGGKGDQLAQVAAGIDSLIVESPKAGQQLEALLSQLGEAKLEKFRKAAEDWFDDGMDRVSGWYKRWAQQIACGVALVVAVVLNANAIGITEHLINEPAVRAAVVSRAEAASAEEKDEPKDAGEEVSDTFGELKALELPIWWSSFPSLDSITGTMIAGWLITAIAISLGAPFWFDALGKLAHLRTTGKKPEPEK